MLRGSSFEGIYQFYVFLKTAHDGSVIILQNPVIPAFIRKLAGLVFEEFSFQVKVNFIQFFSSISEVRLVKRLVLAEISKIQ